MSYQSEVLADSPLVYLRLNEPTPGTGTAQDSSGNAAHGTYVASPAGAAGLLRSASDAGVRFNGTTQWVTSASNMFPLLGQRTFEVWVNRSSNSTGDVFWSSDRSTNRVIFSAGAGNDNITFNPDSAVGGVTWSSAISVGVTAHLVMTFDGSTKIAELWVNGVSKGQLTASSDYVGNANYNLAVSGAGNSPLDGVLDEFAIYNGILSQARIVAHFNAGNASSSVGGAARSRGGIARSFLDGERRNKEKDLGEGISAGLVFPDVPKYAPINPRRGR